MKRAISLAVISLLAAGAASAGPCSTEIDTLQKQLSSTDAGMGPTGTNAMNQTTGSPVSPSGAAQVPTHAPTGQMNEASQNKATSAQDVQMQNTGQGTMADTSTGAAPSSAGGSAEAAASLQRAIERFSQIGDLRLALAARSDMAHALRRGGRFDEALTIYRETIDGWVHFGNRGAVANQLENVAYLAIERGALDRAARLLGAAEGIRTAVDAPMALEGYGAIGDSIPIARAVCVPTAVSAAWDAGKALSLGDAVAFAPDAYTATAGADALVLLTEWHASSIAQIARGRR